MYQLIRQSAPVKDVTVEMEFLDPGVEIFVRLVFGSVQQRSLKNSGREKEQMSSPLGTTNGAGAKPKTMIVTGASQGIGAGVTKAFLERGHNVVANALDFAGSELAPAEKLALVDGNIGHASTAAKVAETAISRFGSIDAVVNNAGIFFTKPFTDYTERDFERLSETNLEGYIYITQLAVKQMLAQKTGGSITCITSAMVEHPIAGVTASIPMITKGGLEAITRSLAMEYAREGIRFNAVAPGVVDTPMHLNDSKEALKSLSPMGMISDVDDIVDAIVYLTEARHVTGEVLHVDAGLHNGKW
jgi:NAD(P)-dependent dehydrogenase (short-subunit alcohol dehydrogenase family)